MALVLLYLLFWAALAVYFSFADRYKSQLETNLSGVFDRPVSIESIDTLWSGVSPKLSVRGLTIQGDKVGAPAFAFDSLTATVSPLSLLTFWPTFTEFDVEKPVLGVTSFADGSLQIAGFTLVNREANAELSQKVVSWLLDQHKASWQDGEIIWRKQETGDQAFSVQSYKNISMSFLRHEQSRILQANVLTPKGSLAFIAKTNGDLLSANNWDASLEVLGNQGESLLKPEDFKVSVSDGRGKVHLKTLDVERIRDFIRLTGLASDARWLLDAKLAGRLYDVNFNFSGPLLSVETWDLKASAIGVGFKSVGRAPAMNNLSGELEASKDGGKFVFAARESEFQWSQWYATVFPINRAMGEFNWEFANNGTLFLNLKNGEFEDRNARITDLFVSTQVSYKADKVSSFADLFTVESIEELSFDGDSIVLNKSDESQQASIAVDAKANFEVFQIDQVASYLPNDKRLALFKKWSTNGFAAGQVTNGKVSYQGELSRDALKTDKATLSASADFANVEIDYAPEQNWPAAKRGKGKATLNNQLLTIMPSEIWLNGDPVTDSVLTIDSLFQIDRALNIKAKTQTSLIKGLDFLFKGPLIKPENQVSELPISPLAGTVDIDINVDILLKDIRNTRVKGTARVRGGRCELPGGVPINEVNGLIEFTERKVSSDAIQAVFLGGDTKGRLVTIEEAQPPVMKLMATGTAATDHLKPWVGEHMLTWFDGVAPWQGSVTIDGGRVDIAGESDLQGVQVTVPAPLMKEASEPSKFTLAMTVGGPEVPQTLSVSYKEKMRARFKASIGSDGSLFDNSLISIGSDSAAPLKPGVNFLIEEDKVNLDDWISEIIDLASLETESEETDSSFMDAMRSINISVKDPVLLGYQTGALNITAVSVDGLYWIGTLDGENVDGTMQIQPRDDIGHYAFNLDYLNLDTAANDDAPLEPVDYSLSPASFPSLVLNINSFRFEGKSLGQLSLEAKPSAQEWRVDKLTLAHNGIRTEASGLWRNSEDYGSLTTIEFNTDIDQAENALNDMDFDGFVRKGKGSVNGELRWIGAPHEFGYSRLNGRFDASIKEGELVKVEPGGGKLLGLLNFNALARRLVFDFRDVFVSGLQFDRMRYAGVLADGEVIFTDAFIFSPAVFVRMEGKLDLDKELVDMEVHIAPELGGNIALLSALANPTAGAVVFITQRLFKDEMRNSSFKSYRALGTWEDFEMLEMKNGEVLPPANDSKNTESEILPKDDQVSDVVGQQDAELEEKEQTEAELDAPLLLENLEASPIEEDQVID
jgi:uncharacterized protein YhdP